MKRKHLILLLIFFCFSCLREKQSNDLKFDSDVWKNGDRRVRGRMSANLEESKFIIGKTREEVENILRKTDVKDNNHWIYIIDTSDDYFDYDYYFNIYFDKKNEKARSSFIGD